MLVIIAADHPREPTLVSDLKATYKWLSEHVDDCENTLLACQSEKLFLNIDGAAQHCQDWRFAAASELWFNAPDEGSRQAVRSYLRPYKEMLLRVGAKEIKKAVRPALKPSPAEETLTKMRATFSRLRREDHLTDVTLESSDEQKLSAHRLILASSTPHFEAMFCSGSWRESQSGATVEIDVPGDILGHVLGEQIKYPR